MEENKTDLMRKIKLLSSIAAYHGISLSQELKEVWFRDFKSHSCEEIEAAWDKWRKTDSNSGKRPKSFDIVSLILSEKRMRRLESPPEESSITAKRGVHPLTDVLIDNIETMNRNMPNFKYILSTCESNDEKIAVCCSAMGKPELADSEVFQLLKKRT